MRRRQRRMRGNLPGPFGLAGRGASAALRGLPVEPPRPAPRALHPLPRQANAAHAEYSDRLLGLPLIMPNSNDVVLEGVDLAKDFIQGGVRLQVLRGASITVRSGERIAIVGASGSGKTTLLQLLGGLDLPTRGTVGIAGSAMNELNDTERGRLRNHAVGFVYQFHHLLPEFTALENVAMPLLVRRMGPRDAKLQAGALLSRVGLAERLDHRPSQLSGGERQRAAVARALVTRPKLV